MPARRRAGAAEELAEAEEDADDAGPPADSPWAFPQNRQNRAPASIDLPHERQKTVPAFAGSELDKAAPLYGRRSRSARILYRRNQTVERSVGQSARGKSGPTWCKGAPLRL